VLTTANAIGINRLTCLPKHGGVRDSKFLVTHPIGTLLKGWWKIVDIYDARFCVGALNPNHKHECPSYDYSLFNFSSN
jgi:hypothetical protein